MSSDTTVQPTATGVVVFPSWPKTLLGELQRVSCQRQLYGVLERHLGFAAMGPDGKPEEDYMTVARMITAGYEDVLRAVSAICERDADAFSEMVDGATAIWKQHQQQQQQASAAPAAAATTTTGTVLVALLNAVVADVISFNRDPDGASPGAVLTSVRDVLERFERSHALLNTKSTSADDEGSSLLPPACLRECLKAVALSIGVDLLAAVRRGAELLAVEREMERERTTTAQLASAQAAPASRAALTSEDKFILAQLQRGGFHDVNIIDDGDADLDDDDFTFEVELKGSEPNFLKGKLPRKSFVSLHAEARRAQNDALFKQNPTSKRVGEIRQAVQALNASEGATETNTMVAAASRQQAIAKERRELRSRKRRLEAQQQQRAEGGGREGDDAPGAAGGGAGERTTRDAGGLANSELDERLEEEGIRGKADLPAGALPPWLKGQRPSRGGGGGSRGDARVTERDEVEWGIKTTVPIAEQRRRLPIAAHRQMILDTIASQDITVLVGETGSGKTTQLAQYLAEAGYTNGGRGVVGCTQPRRVAAISLAERVAEEYGCRVGEEVGYTVRFTDRTSQLTKIKYLTDGMLLREALGDDSFSKYSAIILDEAHERSLNTDVLFGLVKAAAVKRKGTLKVVVTSATLDVERFCEYFGCQNPLIIPGRTHPVVIEHAEAPVTDYVEETLHTVMTIHFTAQPGDILCFLTGQDEIETVAERLCQWMQSEELQDAAPLIVTVIFGALPQENQSLVFEKTPRGSRKVVLATNIAETSITIDDLYYVVDCGFCKQNVYDPATNVETLQIAPISQQQAKQRAGRAGRTGPGKCFRLYTETQFAELPPATVPEIKRTNLINVILTLKATGVHDLLEFDFLDAPDRDTMVLALEKLFHLGALDTDGVLTKLGSRMSAIPLEPTQCKTLLTALDLGCASTVLSIVSMLSTQAVFYRPRERAEEADQRHSRFTAVEGDQLTLLNVYDEWVASGCSADWCRDNFVQQRALKDARDIRSQLERILSRRAAAAAAVASVHGPAHTGGSYGGMGGQPTDVLGPDQASRDTTKVRKALTAGYFYQAAKRLPTDEYRTMAHRRTVGVHPSSTLANAKPRYVIYHELVRTTKEYMRYVMAIDPRWLVELAPNYYATPAPGRLTREQMAERLAPKLRRQEKGNDWRVSKVRITDRRGNRRK